ncbi:hypothetical protein MRX96_015123 [Rhipicephalus microplus]
MRHRVGRDRARLPGQATCDAGRPPRATASLRDKCAVRKAAHFRKRCRGRGKIPPSRTAPEPYTLPHGGPISAAGCGCPRAFEWAAWEIVYIDSEAAPLNVSLAPG